MIYPSHLIAYSGFLNPQSQRNGYMEKLKIHSSTSTHEKLTRKDTYLWDYGNKVVSFEKDPRSSGLSSTWPQRNYRCSFCKKEFKSAQALGGHMNVHRRDRAKMRLQFPPSSWDSSSTDHDLTTTNPNPNIINITTNSSSSSSSPSITIPKFIPYSTSKTQYYCSSLANFSSPSCSKDHDHHEQAVAINNINISHSHQCNHRPPVMKRRDVGMNLNKRPALLELKDLPAVLASKRSDCSLVWMKKQMVQLDLSMGLSTGDEKDDLDLELRLGLS